MCQCCRRGSTLCIISVVAGHVLVTIAISLALVTRYALYSDQMSYDMPTDMRALKRQSDSIFCSSHEVEVIRENPDSIFSNTVPEFDAWKLDDEPHSSNLTPRPGDPYKLISVAGLEEASYKTFVFHLLPGENLTMHACLEREKYRADSSVYLYVIQGQSALSSLLKSLDKKHLTHCTPCLTPGSDPIKMNRDNNCTAGQVTEITFTLNDTMTTVKDDYAFVFFYPQIIDGDIRVRKLAASQIPQKFRVNFELSRMQYAELTGKEPDVKGVSSLTVDPKKYPVLDFSSYRSNPENELYNLIVTFRCVPHTTFYLLFFGAIPMVILIVLVMITVTRLNNSNGGYQEIN